MNKVSEGDKKKTRAIKAYIERHGLKSTNKLVYKRVDSVIGTDGVTRLLVIFTDKAGTEHGWYAHEEDLDGINSLLRA